MIRDYGGSRMADIERRIEISKRLKAARHLAGYLDEKERVRPLAVEELVQLPSMVRNGITRNRIEDIEQLKVDARPMELAAVAAALSLPSAWFAQGEGEAINQPIAELLSAVGQDARSHRRARAEGREGSAGANRPEGAEGGGRQ
jgi:hypothetical protein